MSILWLLIFLLLKYGLDQCAGSMRLHLNGDALGNNTANIIYMRHMRECYYEGQEDNHTIISNHKPLVSTCTIHKLSTSTITSLLIAFGEQHKILYHNQDDLRPMQSTTPQIQAIIETLKVAKVINKDIYLTHILQKHIWLNQPPTPPCYNGRSWLPPTCHRTRGNMYAHSSASFKGAHFITIPPI